MLPAFHQLASPPGIHVTHIPKGKNLVVHGIYSQYYILHTIYPCQEPQKSDLRTPLARKRESLFSLASSVDINQGFLNHQIKKNCREE